MPLPQVLIEALGLDPAVAGQHDLLPLDLRALPASAVTNPPAGTIRLWLDSADGKFKIRRSNGTTVTLLNTNLL